MSRFRLSGWSRADSVVLEGLLAAVLVAVAVFGWITPLLGVAGVIGPIDRTTVGLLEPATLVDQPAGAGASMVSAGEAELVFTDPGVAQRALLAAPVLVGSALALAAVYLLFRIARTLRAGDPFVPENGLRIILIGVVVLAGALLAPVLQMVTSGELIEAAHLRGDASPQGTFTPVLVLVGFCVLALADVFRRGTRLRADTEGLV